MKPRSKQIAITELEAEIINDLMKNELIRRVRMWINGTGNMADVDILRRMQEHYEDILNYIRSKENGI